ncbi:MAG: hypothetical protein ACYSWO_08600 [Planctomycetota bacterium]|jgi:hypothetical protein
MGIIAALAWANRERGTDSLGFFDSSGKMTKRAADPAEALRGVKMQKWLRKAGDEAWFLAGHTRFATRGKVNRRNSHPFRYGRVIGSHNGMVGAPQKFQVDSEYLFWLLNKHRGDYQKALEDVSGYWGLSWYDGDSFYLMCHSGELAVVEVDGVYYYSSSWKHLDSCTGGDSHTFGEGEVWKFNSDGSIQKSTDEGSGVKTFKPGIEDYSYYGRYDGSSARGYSRKWSKTERSGAQTSWWEKDDCATTTDTGGVKDYDKEWADAWSAYCASHTEDGDDEDEGGKSIHSMTDDEYTIYEESN